MLEPPPESRAEPLRLCPGCRQPVQGCDDKCPHCGVFFSYETDETGKVVKRVPVGTFVSCGGIGTLIAIGIGLLIRFLRN